MNGIGFALRLIQSYWVIWLVGSFIVAIALGGIVFRNYVTARTSF